MFPVYRGLVSSQRFQFIPIIPCICLLLFVTAIIWSRAAPISEASLWVVFFSALLSSIAGFAFSPLAGAFLFQIISDTILVVQILLIASIAQQTYCVWQLRHLIRTNEYLPYLLGSLATLLFGIFLLLKSQAMSYLPILGAILVGYGLFTVLRPKIRIRNNLLLGRVAAGALGGITGGLAAFPAPFVTMWCQAQGFCKKRQRSIVQPYILVNQIVAFGALAVLRPMGAVSADVIQYIAPAILGAYFGLRLFKKLNTTGFNRIVGIFLLFAGSTMMAAKPF